MPGQHRSGEHNEREGKTSRASTLLVVAALVSVAVLYVLSAMGAENDQQKAPGPSVAVTDTTAAVGSDGSSTWGVPVTDTTTAAASQGSTTRNTTSTTSAPTTTTQPASTTTAVYVSPLEQRASHPAWDDRLPGTRKGLRATACHGTFQVEMYLTPASWKFSWNLVRAYHTAHDEVIAVALQDPTWEPTPGTALHDALANLGVSSAQDIRDMGDEIEVRWYAWFVKDHIEWTGDPTDPDCASIIAGANAVLTPYQTTTTTTTP